MKIKRKTLLMWNLIFQAILGSTLFYFSLLDISKESTFFLKYSLSKTIILLAHLLTIFIVVALNFFQKNKRAHKITSTLLNNNFISILALILSFISLAIYLIINFMQESFPYWYTYEKIFYLLFFYIILLVNFTIYSILSNKAESKINLFFLLTFFFLVMTLNFQSNFIARVNSQWFDKFKESTDSHITGRLVNWHLDQEQNFSIFMVQYVPNEPSNLHLFTKHLMIEEIPITQKDYNRIEIYTGQTALQATFFGLLSFILPFSLEIQYSIFTWMTSIALSITLTFLIYWIYLELGFIPTIFAWISIIFNKWLTAGGNSTYWQYWTLYLGLVALLYFYKNQKNNNYKMLIFIIIITTYLKFSMGFEYTSAFLITTSLPLFYYACKNKMKLKKFIHHLITIISTSIFSFISCFAILIGKTYLFYQYEKEWQSPMDLIKHRLTRSFGSDNISSLNERYHEVNKATIIDVLKIYLFEGKPLIWNFRASHLLIILILITAIIFIIKATNKKDISALLLTTYISLLGPLSWIVLAKGHSYLHTHFNYILFSIPFIILFATLLGATLQQIIRIFKEKRALL